MRCLLISCTLIIFSFGALHAESEEEKSECYQLWRVQYELEKSCTAEKYQNYNSTVIDNEIRTVITRYSGDNSEFQRVIDKFCPIVDQVLDCTLIGFELDDKCLDQRGKQHHQQEYNISKGLLNYACANSGAAVLPLLQNDAFKSVFGNDELRKCMLLIYGKSLFTDDAPEPSIVSCDGIEKAFECARDHLNSNLLSIANDVQLVFRQAVDCAPDNSL